MPNRKPLTKKITLIAADQKLVRRLAAKIKLTEQQVVELALDAARPLFKLITQGISGRKSVGGCSSSFPAAVWSESTLAERWGCACRPLRKSVGNERCIRRDSARPSLR